MNFLQPDFAPAYPEIFLLIMVCVVLLADLAWGKEKPLSCLSARPVRAARLRADHIRHFFARRGLYVLGHVCGRRHGRHTENDGVYHRIRRCWCIRERYISVRGMLSGEFFSLALFATLGMMVMISASHFLTLYLGLELRRCRTTPWWRCGAIRRGHRGGNQIFCPWRAGFGLPAVWHVHDIRRDRFS